jgi:hypothetical protein
MSRGASASSETALEELADRRRRIGRKGRPFRLSQEDRRESVGNGIAGERAPARHALVEDAAKGPDVRPLVDRLPPRLLGAHELDGSHDHAGTRVLERRGDLAREGVAVGFGTGHQLREPEVEELDPPFRRDHDVGRFQVPVDDSALVRGFQRLRDLARDAEGVGKGQSPAHPVGERFSRDQLEHEISRPARLLGAVDRGDPRMIDGRKQPRLALETRDPRRVLAERFRGAP